jgi:hypothetical protein
MISYTSASRFRAVLLVSGVALWSSCGGGSPTAVPPPAPSPVITTPITTPTTTTLPPVSGPPPDRCANFQAGPVARLAISPRTHQENGEIVPIRVRARPGFDEVWCLDKDKDHRLDFNLNQRNANGRECCWVNDPSWDLDDPNNFAGGESVRDDFGFVYRIRVNTEGARGTVGINATLDGINSAPWQSNSGYSIGPLNMVAMSAAEIQRDCNCIFLGNGQYQGDRCNK